MSWRDCGDADARSWLGDVQVCDRCFDRRVADHTGLPRLPEPPAPLVVVGPDGRRHQLRFRLWRAPTGIEVELEETGVPVGEGYEFAVLGDHDADVENLIARVRTRAETEVGRNYLERASHRDGWARRGRRDRRTVRFERRRAERDAVLRRGRWPHAHLGRVRENLDSYEGWNFRLVIEDSVQDARTDAEVIELRPIESAGDE